MGLEGRTTKSRAWLVLGYTSLYEILAFLTVAAASLAGAAVLTPRRWPTRFRSLVILAAIVHIAGGIARMTLMLAWYGRGDFVRYFNAGWVKAEALRDLDPAPFLADGALWGTQFVERVSALVLFFVGPSLRAEFVVFSLFPVVGLLLIAVSTIRAFSGVNARRLVLLLLFWPSLVFWPSSVGKESLILLAVGLVVYGWWGDGKKVKWLPMLAGLVLAMFIRPHIAMMIAVSLWFADWLAPMQRMTALRLGRGVLILTLAVVVIFAALDQLGVEATQDSMQQFADDRAARTAQGGSEIASATGLLVVPVAFVNVLARPFIWEASNPLLLLSALEVIFFWGLLWSRRTHLRAMASEWRGNRLLLLLVPLTVVLILFYGAFVSNMGILARQRVVVLPLMFVIAEAAPAFRARRAIGLPLNPGQRGRSMSTR